MISSRELHVMGENKEVDNVCTAIERLKRENLEKGIEKGIEKGRSEGIEEGKILLVKTLLLNGLSTEEVKKYAAVTDQEIQRAKELS